MLQDLRACTGMFEAAASTLTKHGQWHAHCFAPFAGMQSYVSLTSAEKQQSRLRLAEEYAEEGGIYEANSADREVQTCPWYTERSSNPSSAYSTPVMTPLPSPPFVSPLSSEGYEANDSD